MQSQPNNIIISLRDVSMQFDRLYALRDINLDIAKHDFLAITGPNGGGKTTLLKIILKLLSPTSGSVTYYDEWGHTTSTLKIGYLPQKNMIDSRFPVTVEDVIASGLLAQKGLFSRRSAADRSAISGMMEQVGVSRYSQQPIGTLSGGQLQRTLLGRALISRPEVVVLDEPLSYVDKEFEHQIYHIIADIAPATTIILVSHEMTEIAPMATRHIIVDETLRLCHSDHHFAAPRCDD